MLRCMSYQYSKVLDKQRQNAGYAMNRQAGDLQPIDTLIFDRVLLSDPAIFRMWALDFKACGKISGKTYRYHRNHHIKIIDTQNSPG